MNRGYKNNFIQNCEISPFGKYDNDLFLLMRILSIIVSSKVLKLKEKDTESIQQIKK